MKSVINKCNYFFTLKRIITQYAKILTYVKSCMQRKLLSAGN